MKKITLNELEKYVDIHIDENTKSIYVTVNDEYRLSLDILGDYALNVNGSIAMNYNGTIYIGSMSNGETIGKDIDEVFVECQRLYEERMKEFYERDVSLEYGSEEFEKSGCSL